MFTIKQIVWAKVRGYPWWPAQVTKVPCADHNYFKVSFIGQNNHALLQPKSVRKYLEHYNNLKLNKYKGLQNSIQLADAQIEKRKLTHIPIQNKNKSVTQTPVAKLKKIKKRGKRKLRGRANGIFIKNQENDHVSQKKQQDKNETKNPNQFLQKQPQQPQQKQQNEQNQQQSCQQQSSESSFDINGVQLIKNVDRKKIQSTQEEIVTYITQFNSHNYENEKECYNRIMKIQKQQFLPEQLVQSKITNMLSYIYQKLNVRAGEVLKKQQIERINTLNHKLKQSVVNFLFDVRYYEYFLKRIKKNTLDKIPEKIIKDKKQNRPYIKKHRKYKRRNFLKKKQNQSIVK